MDSFFIPHWWWWRICLFDDAKWQSQNQEKKIKNRKKKKLEKLIRIFMIIMMIIIIIMIWWTVVVEIESNDFEFELEKQIRLRKRIEKQQCFAAPENNLFFFWFFWLFFCVLIHHLKQIFIQLSFNDSFFWNESKKTIQIEILSISESWFCTQKKSKTKNVKKIQNKIQTLKPIRLNLQNPIYFEIREKKNSAFSFHT